MIIMIREVNVDFVQCSSYTEYSTTQIKLHFLSLFSIYLKMDIMQGLASVEMDLYRQISLICVDNFFENDTFEVNVVLYFQAIATTRMQHVKVMCG